MGISTSSIHYPRDSEDGFEALRILQKKLPAELALQILDCAQYWVLSQVSMERAISYQEHDCRDRAPYLVSDPIQGGRSPVREIRIDIWSHDQGWSSYTEDHGTYRNSWTWFEMGIIRAPGTEGVSEDFNIRLATNMHASRVTQNHQKVYRADDDLPWMRSLQAGDRISIIPRALYPGWQNFVEKAFIEIYTDPLG
ncbi:uncharacterized protein N7473_003728 [Penicillium subrubescens]|uniref:Uncharacterized protein n=1 Tax=Penicillium subrubescens TaxID=1316194 RepID=A0A1Q5T1C3_9EURO|nr:uncharacterized protein N7473_003728 [Penicillium subrubescens]KAJ5906812.1 hypothetical protein N7473_003728 [Penicillium subrubescens]OKO94059.1 hypothetical protein PENSUB_11894 [Penicillium subrubescens]